MKEGGSYVLDPDSQEPVLIERTNDVAEPAAPAPLPDTDHTEE